MLKFLYDFLIFYLRAVGNNNHKNTIWYFQRDFKHENKFLNFWGVFFHLYSCVIENDPLQIKSKKGLFELFSIKKSIT